MSKENVMKFEERVAKEKELQEKLEAAANAYEGDKSDEKAVFEAVIAPVAKDAGLEFTFEEASEAHKTSQDGELDLAEMKSVAGGFFGGICLAIGFGKGDGACGILGFKLDTKSDSIEGTGIGVTTCDGIGVGLGIIGGR